MPIPGQGNSSYTEISALQKILAELKRLRDSITSSSSSGNATEATLQNILTTLQNGREFEQNLVIDDNGDTFLQIRIFNVETGTFDAPIYYNAAGVVSTPIPPLTLVNPQFVLNNIASLLNSINSTLANFDTDFGAATGNTIRIVPETSTYNLFSDILFQLGVITNALDLLNTLDRDSGQATSNTLRVAISDDTRNFIISIDGILDAIRTLLLNFDRGNGSTTSETLRVEIATKLRTPALLRTTTSGILAANSYSQVSVMNVGNADGVLLSATLKPGEVVNYQLDRDTAFTAIDYDATGTEFLISSINWVIP